MTTLQPCLPVAAAAAVPKGACKSSRAKAVKNLVKPQQLRIQVTFQGTRYTTTIDFVGQRRLGTRDASAPLTFVATARNNMSYFEL